MYVTLYKRCILNNEYNEVIDCTEYTRGEGANLEYYSHFTDYLNTLQSYTYNVEDVFITDEGSVNLPLLLPNNEDLQNYNYMRLSYYTSNQHRHRTTRYCFIENIELRDELAIVTYKTDIWHTFSKYMQIRLGSLSRSRCTRAVDNNSNAINLLPREIPVEYDSVKPPIIQHLFKIPSQTSKYNIVLEWQPYLTETSGVISERKTYFKLLENWTYEQHTQEGQQDVSVYNYEFTLTEVIDILNQLTLKQGGQNGVMLWGYLRNCYYNIGNIYVFPKEYNIKNYFSGYGTSQAQEYIELYSYQEQVTPVLQEWRRRYIYLRDIKTSEYGYPLSVATAQVSNDYKYISYGDITNLNEMINNGTDRTITLKVYGNNYDFKLLMETDNKIIEITDDYKVEVPFTSLDGNELSQLKLSRTMGNISNVFNIFKNTLMSTMGFNGLGDPVKTKIEKRNYQRGKGRNRLTSLRSEITNRPRFNTSNPTETALGIFGNTLSLIEDNASVYSSTKGTFSITNGLINAYFGVSLLKIDPQNEDYVNNIIKECGYYVHYVGNFDWVKYGYGYGSGTPFDFNVIKYDFINIYGDFSQRIRDVLEDILLNGVKIWYTKNV